MTHLNKKQSIAIGAGLLVIGYLFFSNSLMDLFNTGDESSADGISQTTYVVEDVIVGNGVIAEEGDTLTVHYVGTLPGGAVFDTSRREGGSPFTFTLGAGEVIRGWDEGLVGMRVGGTRVLVIGPEYGYGASAVGPIPANSTLIFEVELLNAE